jgi:antitoxin HicB
MNPYGRIPGLQPGSLAGLNQTFDEFLRSQGIERQESILAFRRVVAWQLSDAMHNKGISTNELIARLRTCPRGISLFLDDPERSPVLIATLREANAALGNPLIIVSDPSSRH